MSESLSTVALHDALKGLSSARHNAARVAPSLVHCRERKVVARARISPVDARAHHFISMINTLHFMRIISDLASHPLSCRSGKAKRDAVMCRGRGSTGRKNRMLQGDRVIGQCRGRVRAQTRLNERAFELFFYSG